MRINRSSLQYAQLKVFCNEFRKLYADYLSDDEISNILEGNNFVLAAYILPTGFLQEIDIITENPEDFFITLERDGNLSERFEVIKEPIPENYGSIRYLIGGFRVLSNIREEELFLETFEFTIGTTASNEVDINLTQELIGTDNNASRINIIKSYLQTLIDRGDARAKRASYLLNKYPNL